LLTSEKKRPTRPQKGEERGEIQVKKEKKAPLRCRWLLENPPGNGGEKTKESSERNIEEDTEFHRLRKGKEIEDRKKKT